MNDTVSAKTNVNPISVIIVVNYNMTFLILNKNISINLNFR